MDLLVNQLDGGSGNYDLNTSAATVYNSVVDDDQSLLLFFYIDFGYNSGTGLDSDNSTALTLTVTCGDFRCNRSSGLYYYGTTGEERILSPELILRANENLKIDVLSANSSDTAVDLAVYIIESNPFAT